MLSKRIFRLIPLLVLPLLIYFVGNCGKKAQPSGNTLVNKVDEDKDGYYGSFDLRIDANGQTEFDTLEVKAKIISPETKDTIWTDVWTLQGTEAEDAHTVSLSSESFQLTEPTKIGFKIVLCDSAMSKEFDTDSTLSILIDDDDSQAHIKALFAERSPSISNTLDRDNDQFFEKFG